MSVANPEFDLVEGVPAVRLGALTDFARAVGLVAAAIARAVAERRPHLLVCAAEVRFAPPSLAERHQMVRNWAAAAKGRVHLAVVARPEFIDPEGFGIVAAANFGLTGRVFACEADAIAWLRAPIRH